jgi:hypothetical protein
MKPSREVLYEGPFGGTGGDYFNDYTSGGYLKTEFIGVHSIIISYSNQVDSIQVTYLLANRSLYQAPRRGSVKNINPPVEIKLRAGEYVRKIEGQTNGVLINQLSITTHRPKDSAVTKYGPFGTSASTNFSIEGYALGFYGYSGDMLNGIGLYHFILAKKSSVFVGNYQPLLFDESPDTGYFPPVIKIKKLIIEHKDLVYSIQALYQLRDGTTRLGERQGRPPQEDDGHITTAVRFEDDEEIFGIEGTYAVNMCQVSFISRRYNQSTPVLHNGPFGWPCATASKAFAVNGNILGFFGSYTPGGIVGLDAYFN